jgi:hypothetical protein
VAGGATQIKHDMVRKYGPADAVAGGATQIKHDMVRKYGPADAQRETGERKSSNRIVPESSNRIVPEKVRKSSNRIVRAKEYDRSDEETTADMEVDRQVGDSVIEEVDSSSKDSSAAAAAAC